MVLPAILRCRLVRTLQCRRAIQPLRGSVTIRTIVLCTIFVVSLFLLWWLAVKGWFSSEHDHCGAIGDPIMRLHQSSTLEKLGATDAEGSGEVPAQPATLDPWDFSNPSRDEVLALLKQDGNRKRATWLVTAALAVGFGLGWACGLSCYGVATSSVFDATAQPEMPPRQVAQPKSGKSEGTRKTASTSILQTPPVSQASAAGRSISAKRLARWSDGAHSADFSSTTSPGIQADETVTGSIAPRVPLTPAPDTRPITIEGWTVLDVRGGTAILAGPDGVRMAMRGDTVPGIGRIDSIVRWGDRWIVATNSGLIATP